MSVGEIISQVRLSPFAVGCVAQLLLLVFIAIFALKLRGGEDRHHAVRLLRWMLACFCVYLVLLTGEHTMVHPNEFWWVFPQMAPVSFAAVFLLRFAYAYWEPSSRDRLEARIVTSLAMISPLWEMGSIIERFIILRSTGYVEWRSLNQDFLLNAIFLWTAIVLARKTRAILKHQQTRAERGSETDDLKGFQAWSGSARSAAALSGLCVFLGFLVLISSNQVIQGTDEFRHLTISIGSLIAIYWFGAVAIHEFGGSRSFQVRFVGLTLLIFLAMVIGGNWVLVNMYLRSQSHAREPWRKTDKEPAMLASRQSWIFHPKDDHSYVMAPRTDRRTFELGSRVFPASDSTSLADRELPFPFPYFDAVIRKYSIHPNGYIAFAQMAPGVSSFRWRYGSAATIVAGLSNIEYGVDDDSGIYVFERDDLLIVTWRGRIQLPNRSSTVTLQAELYRDGRIALNFVDVDAPFPSRLLAVQPVALVGLIPGQPTIIPIHVPLVNGRLEASVRIGPEGFVWHADRQIRDQLNPLLLRVMMLTLIGSAFISTVVPWLIRRTLIRPIHRLMEGIDALDSGAPLKNVPVERKDEMGFLTASFNRMARSIRASETQLVAGRDRLEVEVSARTAELKAEIERRQQLAEERDRARIAAESANRAKSEFLATMSHEIRTPMNGIIGSVTLLSDTALNSRQKELANITRSSAEALLTLLNDILDFTKIEAGHLAMSAEPVEISAWIRSVIEAHAPIARQKSLELNYWIDPSTPCRILGDPSRLRQILTNLISNALKFTERGGIHVDVGLVDTDTETEAKVLRVDVHDSGIGMTSDTLNHLFQPFSQGDNASTRRFGGTGLGLAISRRLVELMHGRIGVTSTPGEGSRFWFEFPIHPVGAETLASVLPVLSDKTAWLITRGERDRAFLLRWLNAMHLRVEHAPDWNPSLLKGCRPHIVFWDASASVALSEMQSIARQVTALPHSTEPDLQTSWILLNTPKRTDLVSDNLPIPFVRRLDRPVLLESLISTLRLHTTGRLPQPAQVQNPESQTTDAVRRKSIIVGDDPVHGLLLKKMLQRMGYDLRIVSDPEKAPEIIIANPCSIIFLDTTLSNVDALNLTHHIRNPQTPIPAPIIVRLTDPSAPELDGTWIEAGVSAFLTKPVRISSLESLLQTHVPVSYPETTVTSP
jgi:signal transduction histidine kinase/CheY-like chemotaxis protein